MSSQPNSINESPKKMPIIVTAPTPTCTRTNYPLPMPILKPYDGCMDFEMEIDKPSTSAQAQGKSLPVDDSMDVSDPPKRKLGRPKSLTSNVNAKLSASGKGKKRKKVDNDDESNSRYKFVCMAKEDHGQPIFGCQLNQKLKEGEPLILATVGSNRVSIYECTPEGPLKMLQVYADPDKEEIFYCCAWTDDGQGKPLLAAGGAGGIIRVFSPAIASCIKHYVGHGQAINDLLFHPMDGNLLLSASKDHSLRLWNVKTDFLVAIFGGVDGHRDEVLGADIDINGLRVLSCGMDHSIKVWKLKKPEIEKAISLSYTYNPKSSRPFPTIRQNFPDFSTRDIHRNYVDCAKWFGEFIMSKSCENMIVFWKGGKTFEKWDDIDINTTNTTLIHRLDIDDCEIWFIRFSLDYWKRTLALGNTHGKTFVYNLAVTEPALIETCTLTHPKCISAVRQTALSRDGKVLICVCDDGTIWRWNEIEVNSKD